MDNILTKDNMLDCLTLASFSRKVGLDSSKISKYIRDVHNCTYSDYRNKVVNSPEITDGKLDWVFVDMNLRAGASAKGIAASLGISPSTLYSRCEAELGIKYSTLKRRCKAKGHNMLKSKIYEVAMSGDVRMLQWLADKIDLFGTSDSTITLNLNYHEGQQV